MSPPVWGRGLKFFVMLQKETKKNVAPCVGAWVEML